MRFKSSSATVGLAALAVLTMVGAPAGQAREHGEVQDPVFWLENIETGRCLDDSHGGGLRTLECNQLRFQKWRMLPSEHGEVLQNEATGRCLDDSDAFKLRAYECNGGTTFQSWRTRDWESGTEFLNAATGLCLDDSTGGGVRTFRCGGGSTHQQWRIFSDQ
ncbi:RICIN domain-containing protein [Streptomyces sp. NPDC050504]|uniref:RICIN domain-containing protein n=1 Tax=Streptomyces sp. NPDC050504 TaxID=3365618 RepID=UPI0037A27E61